MDTRETQHAEVAEALEVDPREYTMLDIVYGLLKRIEALEARGA